MERLQEIKEPGNDRQDIQTLYSYNIYCFKSKQTFA